MPNSTAEPQAQLSPSVVIESCPCGCFDWVLVYTSQRQQWYGWEGRRCSVQPDRSPSRAGTRNTCCLWQRLKDRHLTVRLLLCLGIQRWWTGWWQGMKRHGLNQLHRHTFEVWFWSGF